MDDSSISKFPRSIYEFFRSFMPICMLISLYLLFRFVSNPADPLFSDLANRALADGTVFALLFVIVGSAGGELIFSIIHFPYRLIFERRRKILKLIVNRYNGSKKGNEKIDRDDALVVHDYYTSALGEGIDKRTSYLWNHALMYLGCIVATFIAYLFFSNWQFLLVSFIFLVIIIIVFVYLFSRDNSQFSNLKCLHLLREINYGCEENAKKLKKKGGLFELIDDWKNCKRDHDISNRLEILTWIKQELRSNMQKEFHK